MAEQTSRLAVIIDSSGAQKNSDSLTSSLAKLTQAGEKAEQATENLTDATKDYNSWLRQGPKLADSATKSTQAATKATNDEAKALGALLDKINPINAALSRLDDQQQALSQFKSKGMLDEEAFTEYNARIEQAREKLAGFSEQLSKTGETSRHAAHNMAMIPSQLSWMITSIASGQSPIMALVQQGSMLSGMMGGVGPAIRGVGVYLAGLINPLTLAATAVGVLGLAYYEGEQEQEAFRKSLILTGNQVGKTADQLSDMATTISNVTGSTHGQAASVINQVVSAGNIAGDSLQKVSAAIVSISDATGQATDKLVSDFSNIANDPVAAITKLNDQYHFLTLATYNQIKALQDEGDQQDAAKAASDAYATALSSRASEIKQNLGYMERGWDSLGNAAKFAWDKMLNVGREDTLQQQISKLEAEISERSKPSLGSRFISADHNNNLNALKAQLSFLQSQATTQDVLNGFVDKHNQAQQAGIKAQEYIDNLQDQSLSNAEKRTKEQNLLTEALKKTRAAGTSISVAEEAQLRQDIDNKYKDPAAPKQRHGKAYTEDAGSRLVDQLNQQHAALVAQLDTTQKLGTAQQELVKWQTKLDGLSKKQNLTNDEKSLLAHQKQITAAYQRNANDELDQQAKVEARKIADYQNQLSQQLQTAINANAASQQGLGMGSLLAGRYKYLQQLQAQQDTDSNALLNKRDRGDITDSTYQAELTSLRSYYQQRAQIAKEGYAQEDAARQDWQKGLTNGLHNSIDAANDMYSQMSTLAQTAFTGMADSLANFVVTGKASFKDFTTTILTDLAKIEMERALAGIATSIFSFSGTSANAGTAISSTASSTGALGLPTSYTGYDSGGFTGVGGKYDPAGIVHKGEFVFTQEATNRIGKDNLARLMKGYSSGGYVGSPTPSSAVSTNQSSGSNISLGGIVVNVNSQGQASSDSSTGGQGIAKQIQAAVVNTINEQANKQGTPLWRAIKGR